MKVCIISGRYPSTHFESFINHKVYADKHGYSYIHCNWPTKSKNKYLNKIEYIISYFGSYDFIFWIDDDAFFFDFEKDIMEYAPKNDSFISLCKSPSYKELKTYFSSGQFMVKCNELSLKFLNTILHTDMIVVEEWWKEELGYFSNGDQDIMIYLLLADEEFKGKMDLYDYKCFNSRFENLFEVDIHQPFILHFAGKVRVKHLDYQTVQQKFNLPPSLVPASLLSLYNTKIPDPYIEIEKRKSLLGRVKGKIKRIIK